MKLIRLRKLGLWCVGAECCPQGCCSRGERRLALEEIGHVMKGLWQRQTKPSPGTASECQCVVIVPGMKKAAFIIGAKYGKGFLLCARLPGPVGLRLPL